MRLSLIVAMADNHVIGHNNRLPWHLPADLKHFRAITLGKPVLMGRKTWESIGRPLPGRQNLVVTRSGEYRADGAECASSLSAALQLAEGVEVMVIGGGELYRLALPLATRMVLTLVDCLPEADTWFPAWDESEWRVIRVERFSADQRNPLAYEIRELVRITSSTP